MLVEEDELHEIAFDFPGLILEVGRGERVMGHRRGDGYQADDTQDCRPEQPAFHSDPSPRMIGRALSRMQITCARPLAMVSQIARGRASTPSRRQRRPGTST